MTNKERVLESKKKSVWLVLLLIPFVYIGSRIPENFAVTTSASLSHRIYFLVRLKKEDKIHRGDYVWIRSLSSKYIDDGKEFSAIKRVACNAGDLLEVSDQNYSCNGRYLGRAKRYSLKGVLLKDFIFNGIIPEGEIFVMGEHKDSFDSRYLGFIKRDNIGAVGIPII
ncbi:MAG: S26 family signal peptidase [Nitrospinota bacterium]|nr:S26 family signal peptidase [Nitrospinota bacterium]